MRNHVFGVFATSVAAVAVTLIGGRESNAAVFEYPLTVSGPITSTAQIIPVNTAGATGRARAFYVTGEWSAAGGGPWSSEFRVQLVGVTNQGGGLLDRLQGGFTNGNPYSFVPPAPTTWANNTTNPLGLGVTTYLVDTALADLGGTFDVGLRQTFAGSSANLSDAKITFVTDIIAPVPVSTVDGPTMVQRPTSLTAQSTNGPYRYQAITVTAEVTGAYHFGVYTGGADAYLYVYRGSFDPQSPLTNLAGLDDIGDLGDANSSSLWLGLTAGETVVAVVTTFAPTNNVTSGLFTFAGPIPEPAALGLLAPVAVMAMRRRRA